MITVINGTTSVASSFLNTCRVSKTVQLWAQVVLGRLLINLQWGVIHNFWGYSFGFRRDMCLVVCCSMCLAVLCHFRQLFIMQFLPGDLLAQVLNPVKDGLHTAVRHFQTV